MDPSIEVGLCWLLFAGTHVGLATLPVRRRLVARLGLAGFTLLFVGVAAVTFSLLVHTYAAHRFEGAAGLALGRYAPVRWLAITTIAVGFASMTGAFATYPSSPMALVSRRVRAPRGLERVTRHPFFLGTALLGIAHALLATRLVGTVAFGGLALFSIVGALLQDQKLLALRGDGYAAYRAASSFLPFAAIARGRQQLAWRELPFGTLAVGLALAWVLRSVHEGILGAGGAYAIGAVLAGAGLLTLQDWLRVRRNRAAEAPVGPVAG
jgi:uncharacterized membrane protein